MTTATYSSESFLKALISVSLRQNGHYGGIDQWLYQALERYPIRGKTVLLVGSCEQGFGPWYEAVCLHFGTQRLVTTDYNEIKYDFILENLQFWTQDRLFAKSFDAILSISTFEHSGLGRYGEPPDPDGDLKAMKWASTLLKDDGLLYLAVPLGKDKVVRDLHRIYGTSRLNKLLEGWHSIDSFGLEWELLSRDTGEGWNPRLPSGELMHPEYPEYSPIFVLRKDASHG